MKEESCVVWCKEEGNYVVYKKELLCGKRGRKQFSVVRRKEPCRVIRSKGKLCVARRKVTVWFVEKIHIVW